MSGNNDLLEMYKQLQASNDKYTYFLLAAAGTAIGFAVQKMEGLLLSSWLIPVGLAILCWGFSFFCGCKNIAWVQATIRANSDFLKLKVGIHRDRLQYPAHTAVAISTIWSVMEVNASKAQFYTRWQFRLLIAGAIFFISWRLLEMVKFTYAL